MFRNLFNLMLALALIAQGAGLSLASAAKHEHCEQCPQAHHVQADCPCCPDQTGNHGCAQSCDGCCAVLAVPSSVTLATIPTGSSETRALDAAVQRRDSPPALRPPIA
jgi:hypothetical protein